MRIKRRSRQASRLQLGGFYVISSQASVISSQASGVWVSLHFNHPKIRGSTSYLSTLPHHAQGRSSDLGCLQCRLMQGSPPCCRECGLARLPGRQGLWPVYNLAPSCITMGTLRCCWLCWDQQGDIGHGCDGRLVGVEGGTMKDRLGGRCQTLDLCAHLRKQTRGT